MTSVGNKMGCKVRFFFSCVSFSKLLTKYLNLYVCGVTEKQVTNLCSKFITIYIMLSQLQHFTEKMKSISETKRIEKLSLTRPGFLLLKLPKSLKYETKSLSFISLPLILISSNMTGFFLSRR